MNSSTAVSSSQKLVELVNDGRFHLTKFCSNDTGLVLALSDNNHQTKVKLQHDYKYEASALGVTWSVHDDTLVY